MRRTNRAIVLIAVLGAVLAACGAAASPARPTDPRELLVQAVKATAALPTARLHVEMTTSMTVPPDVGVGAGGAVDMAMAMDADVDLEHRALAGRQTSTFSGDAAGMFGGQNTSTDIIVTPGGTFMRQQGMAKWMSSGAGAGGGPTNATIADGIAGLLTDTRVAVERRDPVDCSLGRCDDLVVHIPKEVLAQAMRALSGDPTGALGAGMAGVPDLDLDVRIDLASPVISEIRFEIAAAGTTAKVAFVLTQPGQPVTIAAPAPGLIDDTTGGFGGFGGGGTTTILSTVGSEIEDVPPDEATPEPSLP